MITLPESQMGARNLCAKRSQDRGEDFDITPSASLGIGDHVPRGVLVLNSFSASVRACAGVGVTVGAGHGAGVGAAVGRKETLP